MVLFKTHYWKIPQDEVTAFLNFYMIKMTSMPNNWNMSKWHFFLKGYRKQLICLAIPLFSIGHMHTYTDAYWCWCIYLSPIYHLSSPSHSLSSTIIFHLSVYQLILSIPCIFLLFACGWVKIQPEQAFQVNFPQQLMPQVKNYHTEMLTCTCKSINK